MKTHPQRKASRERGNALLLVMMTTVISAIALAGAMQWVSTNSRLTLRNNEYYRAVAAAEAATEKVVGMMARDFRENDWSVVNSRLDTYRAALPTENESAHWQGWAFTDPSGSTNGVYVARRSSEQFVELNSQYVGLRGMAATYSVIANASQVASQQETPVAAAVRQQFQLATIPIFQFAIFYGILMELHPGQNFDVIGRVHSNDALYYSIVNGNTLNFNSHVTSVGSLVHGLAPLDPRNDMHGRQGTVSFNEEADQHVAHLHLPIGTNNTPSAVREILMPPPAGESPGSAMGQQRYYNKSDMIITVANTGVTVTSGRVNSFATVLSTNDWQKFVTTTNSFRDHREEKTVLPVDINVAALRQWSTTNSVLRPILPNYDVSSIYVDDQRSLTSSQLAAVRLRDGAVLPDNGLTVATARPLYIQGNYNQPNSSHLGTTNTTATKPASIASDAINILSAAWTDAKSTDGVGDRVAANTTVNAAFLSGIVPSANGHYSGGVENYPRLHETWGGSRTLTYNGSMVVLFPSQYATARWGKNNVYSPPNRKWTFDLNFLNEDKLPPGTPKLSAMIRGSWTVIPVGSTNSVYEAEVINIGGGG